MAGEEHDAGLDGLTLSVHPSVVFRLGEEMIQDDVQALVELAKNAYDADSATARISVDTQVITTAHGDEVSDAEVAGAEFLRGSISVVDRGSGMTSDQIVEAWLTVSGSPKRELKRRNGTTSKGRTPVGDKGLGRLGTQRLGRVVDLYTVVKGSGVAHRLSIPWDEYESAERLDSVRLELRSEPAPATAHGTTLTIRGLRNLDHWRGDAVQDLERRLSAMISPFGKRGFDVTLNVDGQPIDLLERPAAVRSNAMLRYELDYGDQVLTVKGSATQDYFRPDRGGADKRATFDRAMAQDGGAAFLRWLLDQKADQARSFGLAADDDHFLAFNGRFPLTTIDGVARDEGQLVDPGPFVGEVDMVRLRDDSPDVFSSARDYSTFVKEINGVRIYRDGFGIPISKDWLDLASRWSSGASFYNLRPENIIGFIDLTAAGNPALEETSSREQFRDTLAYRSFLAIMERWRRFTESIQTFLRRSFNEYLAEFTASSVGGEVEPSPTVLIKHTELQHAHVDKLLTSLDQTRRSVEQALESAQGRQRESDGSLFPGDREQLAQASDQLRGFLVTINQLSADIDGIRSSYERQRDALVVIREQFDTVQAQLSEAWETVALGLTAEALSHEVSQVVDRLRQRTQNLLRRLKSPVDEVTVRTYAEHVMSATSALTRQLAHLNPALRYRRERRQSVTMSAFLAEVEEHFASRWKDLGRDIRMSVGVVEDFAVDISPGRLSQVLDNLILNSEYWINQSRRPGSITMAIERPFLTIADSGPGIDPNLEGLIFEPFISSKSGEGRGLGLFIVRQLLEPEGATIELSPERGDDGRRREFRIAFTRLTTEPTSLD